MPKKNAAKKSRSKAVTRKVPKMRFPGESAAYRRARDELLKAEIKLRRDIENVAALRRRLPLGGAVLEDYVFEEGPADLADTATPRTVRLSELFTHEAASLVIYSYMYGPAMANPCPNCTSILDGLNAIAPHATQRINLAVVAKSPIERLRTFARTRGWRKLRLLSSANNSYNRDYYGENDEGGQRPNLNVFVKRNGRVHHVFATELMFAPAGPGMDQRHVDAIWPLWNLFDFTPEGRGANWYPKLSYA